MLADCLDNSPHLYVFPWETRIIPWFVLNVDRFGDLADEKNLNRLFSAFKTSAEFRRRSLKEDAILPDVLNPTLFGVIDAVYRTLALKKKGTRRWLEKSPMNIQFMTDIASAIPSAQFIHIYRDGRDVAISNQRRFYWALESSAYRWVNVVRKGREDGLRIGCEKYMELRYEDFTDDPEHWMNKICRFIDIPYDSALLKSGMPWLNGPGRSAIDTKTGGIVQNSGKWKTALNAGKLAGVERFAGKLLKELGYATDHPNSEATPFFLQKVRWLWNDYVSRIRYHFAHTRLLKQPGRKLRSYAERLRYKKTLRG